MACTKGVAMVYHLRRDIYPAQPHEARSMNKTTNYDATKRPGAPYMCYSLLSTRVSRAASRSSYILRNYAMAHVRPVS